VMRTSDVKKLRRQNEKGMASLEAIALVTIFTVLLSYGLGMFGIIHSGILNSIAARTYAWETFAHRTNVTFFRDNRPGGNGNSEHYLNFGFRAHGISSEKSTEEEWVATERPLSIGQENEPIGRNTATHKSLGGNITRRERGEVSPVWIKTIYGICMNSRCGAVKL
jgi:hypothetical protein